MHKGVYRRGGRDIYTGADVVRAYDAAGRQKKHPRFWLSNSTTSGIVAGQPFNG